MMRKLDDWDEGVFNTLIFTASKENKKAHSFFTACYDFQVGVTGRDDRPRHDGRTRRGRHFTTTRLVFERAVMRQGPPSMIDKQYKDDFLLCLGDGRGATCLSGGCRNRYRGIDR